MVNAIVIAIDRAIIRMVSPMEIGFDMRIIEEAVRIIIDSMRFVMIINWRIELYL